jgi:hypothetical protein
MSVSVYGLRSCTVNTLGNRIDGHAKLSVIQHYAVVYGLERKRVFWAFMGCEPRHPTVDTAGCQDQDEKYCGQAAQRKPPKDVLVSTPSEDRIEDSPVSEVRFNSIVRKT